MTVLDLLWSYTYGLRGLPIFYLYREPVHPDLACFAGRRPVLKQYSEIDIATGRRVYEPIGTSILTLSNYKFLKFLPGPIAKLLI